MAFRIYTKTGDDGTTGLLGGTRIPKYALRIEVYGTLDELNSHLGLLIAQLPREIEGIQLPLLTEIQDRLFVAGGQLAADPSTDVASKMKLPSIEQADIQALEDSIDDMDDVLPPLKAFILPGGHLATAQAHICRTVCRRAERLATHLAQEEPIPEILLPYLNRLSDWFFTYARYISLKTNSPEIEWHPKPTLNQG